MHWPSSSTISSDVALRALAISGVVFNHSHPVRPFDYAGGMTVLMMLSGYSFARFALQDANAQSVRRAAVRLAAGIWLPCVAIVLLSFVARRQFSLTELLFVGNLFSGEILSFMFVWYPQVLLQILAFTYALFCIPAIADKFLRNPLQGSTILLATAIAATAVWHPYAQVDGPHPIWPWLIAWNFLLGWVVFFALRGRAAPGLGGREIPLVSAAIICAAVAFGPASLGFWTLSAAVAIIAVMPRVTMPSFAARALYVVGQASFTIFLLHVIFLRVYEHVLRLEQPEGAWVFAMAASTLVWVVGSAAMRAFSRELREVKPATPAYGTGMASAPARVASSE